MVLPFTILVIYMIGSTSGNNTVEVSSNTTTTACPPFRNVENGYVKLIEGETVLHIKCKPGHDLIGPPKILCVEGKWETTQQPRCAALCPKPPSLTNGNVEIEEEDEGSTYRKGTLATYKCNDGFVLTPPDSQYRVCEKGIWTGANVTCAPVEKLERCKSIQKIRNGYFTHSKMNEGGNYMIGHMVQHYCNNGFFLKGDPTQRCSVDGVWVPKMPPICLPNDVSRCSAYPRFPHSYNKLISGFQNYDSAEPGTEVEISCLPRYRNVESPCEPSTLRCIAGQWMGIPPNCVEMVSECRCPPTVNLGLHFVLTPTSFETEKTCRYPINTTISYQCRPGYELEGYSILTCGSGGCWEPADPPVCKMKQRYYYVEANGDQPIVFSLATGAGVLLLLVIACLTIVLCRKRKTLSRSVAIPPPVPRADLADHASLLHPPDRLALIAFADGMQVGQSGLPTYEEATRDRNLGISSSRLQRPPWPTLVGRRSRNSPNPDNILFTRQGSFASHSASTRSGGDPMGSTDTMAVSENSTTVTLDTASSHSGSQPASCRAHCGSLASFDTSSVLNTEGVPLLEESELEELQYGETVSLAMENRSMCDNTSYKLSTASDVA